MGVSATMVGTGVGIGRLTLEPDDSILKNLQDQNKSLNIKLTENDQQTNKLDLTNSDLVKQLQEARMIHRLQKSKQDKELKSLKEHIKTMFNPKEWEDKDLDYEIIIESEDYSEGGYCTLTTNPNGDIAPTYQKCKFNDVTTAPKGRTPKKK